MKTYTVVLLRPEYLINVSANFLASDVPYGQDIYVGLVIANDTQHAITIAQIEVTQADRKEGLKPEKSTDYKLCVLFEGIQSPKLFGWQINN